jgi:hypothetical protein
MSALLLQVFYILGCIDIKVFYICLKMVFDKAETRRNIIHSRILLNIVVIFVTSHVKVRNE